MCWPLSIFKDPEQKINQTKRKESRGPLYYEVCISGVELGLGKKSNGVTHNVDQY